VNAITRLDDLFASRAAQTAAVAVFALALLGALWWPGLRVTAGLYDVAALLAVPFLLYALVLRVPGRAFGVLMALGLLLFIYWAFITSAPVLFLIITARLLEGFALYWLAAYCFSRASLTVLERIALVLAGSVAIAAVILPRLTGETGHYGVVSLPFDAGPIHAGVVFVMLALWSLLFVEITTAARRRLIWGALCGAFVALTLWSLSRVSIVAVSVTLLYVLWRRDWRTLAAALVAGAVVSAVLLVLWNGMSCPPICMRLDLEGAANSRWHKWEPMLDQAFASWTNLLFGTGPGTSNALYPPPVTAIFGADSQYVRSLVEFGVIGSLAMHGIFLLALLEDGWKQRLFSLYVALLLSCGVFFVTHEVLMLGKPMTVIFLLAGALSGLMWRDRLLEPLRASQPEQAH
jgi:hypothetical protein